eukprot:12956232-Alexandrium_andersonii.AAC.1
MMNSAWAWWPTGPADGGGVWRNPIGGAEVTHLDARRRPAQPSRGAAPAAAAAPLKTCLLYTSPSPRD